MSSKELLKSARDAISNKDYALAKSKCSSLLQIDPSNGLALVYLGLCEQNLDHFSASQTAYISAITANPLLQVAYQV
jgi:tetratricopeptide (TPR) repeat protein